MRPTIRVTQIEKFRRYLHEVSSFDTEESVIDSITGTFKGNEKTRVGTAFHSIVETGKYNLIEGSTDVSVDVEGYTVLMNSNQCKIALDYRNQFPGAFHEVRLYKSYGEAVVTGCADLVYGIEIHDIKTRYSQPTCEEYTNSCQWKYYLDLFDLDVFHYDVFVFKDRVREDAYDVRNLPFVPLDSPIICYRYDSMQRDNEILLEKYLEWADQRGMIEYLCKQNPK